MEMYFTSKTEIANTRFKGITDHLYSDLNDEAVILSMSSGKYYGLNNVGATIWKSIRTPATLKDIESAVMAEFDVSADTCRQEILDFLRKMSEEELIEVSDATNS